MYHSFKETNPKMMRSTKIQMMKIKPMIDKLRSNKRCIISAKYSSKLT